MNETPILDQLRIYSQALVEDLPNTATDIVNAPAPLAPRPPEHSRAWVVAAAAAALTLIVVGGVAWLLAISDSAPPAGEPMPTTIPAEITVPEPTIPTDDPVTPITIASTDTTLPVEPAPPLGEGPKLGFVQAESPTGQMGDGVWFKGALYTISGEMLFRSSDGFTWERLPGPPDDVNRHDGISWTLETGGGLLMYVGVDETGGDCSALPGDAIVVHRSIDGVDWESSRIDLPIPDSSNTFGCYGVSVDFEAGLAVGPQGIMIAADVSADSVAESIFEAEFGLGLDPETLEVAIGGGFMEVTTADGEVYEIDLDASGYLDDIESWLGVASDDPNFAELVFRGSSHNVTGYAWFSPDGQIWGQLDASGPLDGGRINKLAATSGGFVATSSSSRSLSPSGPAQSVLWETTDGTAWTEKSTLIESRLTQPSRLDEWNGRLVAVTGEGVWTIEETPQHLLTAASDVMEIGEFGLIGVQSNIEGGGVAEIEILFSEDGSAWNRWTPPEFGPMGTIDVVGIGDDFVVLHVWASRVGRSHWVGRLP